MRIVTRESAALGGLRRYFTGDPCSQGHVAERYTIGGACVECNRKNNKAQYQARRSERLAYMSKKRKSARLSKGTWCSEVLRNAKRRAENLGLEFDIAPEDIELPDVCPALGVPIIYDAAEPRANRPSLDRSNNALGYVRGNVRVISFRANQIKNDASADELRRVLQYVTSLGASE